METSLEMEIIREKCRTCLSSINSDNAVSIFNEISVQEKNIRISKLVMTCASVQILDDSYPNSICKICLDDVKTAYLFKNKCEEAEKQLRDQHIQEVDVSVLLKVEVEESEDVDDYVLYDLDETEDASPSFVDVKSEDSPKSKSNKQRKRPVNYKCSECTSTFSKYTEMTAHRETHTEFKCKHCPHKVPKLGTLRSHIRRKHKNVKNPSYGFEVDSDTDTDNSDNNDSDHKDPLDALNCTDSNNSSTTVNYKCCQCSDTFTNEDDLNSHRNIHNSFKCSICNSSFEFYEAYATHKNDCNQSIEESKQSRKDCVHECKNCSRVYPTKILLRRHLHVCKAKSAFPCLSCPEVFITYNNLLEHRKVHRSIDCKHCGLKVLRKSLAEHVSSSHFGAQFCIECRQCFESFDLLDEHYKTHTKFCCRECGNTFNEINAFTMHLDTHKFEKLHPENNTCINCEKDYSERKQLLRHYKSHTEFSCNECEQNFNTPLNLLKHSESHETDDTPVEERTCIICSKQFKIIENMWKHRATHNADNSETLYCPYCDFKARNKIVLGQHMNLDHDSHKTIFCSMCEKSFFCPRKLRIHMLTHTGEKRHVCDVCGHGFATRGNLVTHIRTHTGEKPYKCEICGKGFAQNSALKSHMVFHKPSKDHVCPECGMCFVRLSGLRIHKLKHTTERPYECSTCQKAFKGKRELKEHEHIHTGIRNFKCNYCGKAFGRKSNLTTHLKIHTGETPHVCTVCGKGFIQLHVLRTHMNTHD